MIRVSSAIRGPCQSTTDQSSCAVAGPSLKSWVALTLRSADTTAIYRELAQTAALLHALTLLKPDKEADEALPVLDKLRDLAILSQWRDDGALAEFHVRLR